MKDPYTHLGVRIPKKAKPWLMIAAWITLILIFLYGIAKIAEKFEGSVEWP